MGPGIHELTAGYALDALDPDERKAYEEHLPGCQTCQEELIAFQEVSGALALGAAGPAPPPELRDRILESARAESQNVVPLRRRGRQSVGVYGAIAAIAAVVAIALGTWAVSLHGRLGTANDRLAAQERIAAIVSDPAARTVPFAKGDGKLVVTPDGRAVMVVDGLEPAQHGKTYELWVIRGTAPTRAGLFGGGDRSVVAVDGKVGKDAVVAVTLEPAGGVDAPTSTPVAASQPV
jgi:anti-sigma-K factor RskA